MSLESERYIHIEQKLKWCFSLFHNLVKYIRRSQQLTHKGDGWWGWTSARRQRCSAQKTGPSGPWSLQVLSSHWRDRGCREWTYEPVSTPAFTLYTHKYHLQKQQGKPPWGSLSPRGRFRNQSNQAGMQPRGQPPGSFYSTAAPGSAMFCPLPGIPDS